jgi:phosphopantetheine--protein transferase-like protein
MIPGTAIIHVLTAGLPLRDDDACLSPEEIHRASTFKFQTDAARWKSFRTALRRTLADTLGISPRDVPIQLGEFGKPALAPPFHHLHFNLSHSHDSALVAICADGPVGIDIEALDRAPSLLECVDSFCHPDEINALPQSEPSRSRRLLEIWTAKEALLKALGTGLSHPPEQVLLIHHNGALSVSPETPLKGSEAMRILHVRPPAMAAFLATIAVPSSVTSIIGAEISF